MSDAYGASMAHVCLGIRSARVAKQTGRRGAWLQLVELEFAKQEKQRIPLQARQPEAIIGPHKRFPASHSLPDRPSHQQQRQCRAPVPRNDRRYRLPVDCGSHGYVWVLVLG